MEEIMDPKLETATRLGDIPYLREAIDASSQANNNHAFFLTKVTSTKPDGGKVGNIFHLAAWEDKHDFFNVAMESLPTHVVELLLSQHEPTTGWGIPNASPLHVAACLGRLQIVKLILGFYKSSVIKRCNNSSKPWLGRDGCGSTPLHLALEQKRVECALELLSFDMESFVMINDFGGNSVIFRAMENGCTQVALEILKSSHLYSFTGSGGLTPLHFLPNCSNQEVCKLLVQRHPELIKAIGRDGSTILHKWFEIGKLWPFEYLLNTNDIAPECKMDLISLIDLATDKIDKSPLLVALHNGDVEATKILVDAYKRARQQASSSSTLAHEPLPWLRCNKLGKTPLDLAILEEKEEIAFCFLSQEINSVLQGKDNSLFLAIERQCHKVAEKILEIEAQYGWSVGLTSGHGRNILHGASHYKEIVATWLVKKLPCFISEQDDDKRTPLDEASRAGAAWLIEAMLKTDPCSLRKAPLAWIEACERGHLSAVLAFIHHCPNLRDVCLEHHDTPLHHIKLEGYTAYKELLEIPVFKELKYTQDSDGATPLHRAIMNKNIGLAEALLTTFGLDWRIKDKDNKTAMDLLATECTGNQSWDEMCKRIGINPKLKMTYVQHETNLLDMRSTLLVVAALLATITFTAGFTLPGGFDSDSGEAILAKKAVFLVFLIADTYAMCCSMLVLFCLIWSMVCDHNRSLLLIDRSLVILLQSLYGTLVAFMTGVFTVIFHKSFWAGVLIIVMCCLIAISATIRIVLYEVLDKLVPATDEHRFQNQLLQLGRTWITSSRNPTAPVSNV